MEQQQTPEPVFGKPGFAMPMMRGFPCAVSVPMMGANAGPKNGLGIGWANVEGHGVMFFVSVHAGDGLTLQAELDYARYKRLAELLASAGQQAQLVDHAAIATNDPLAALSIAHQALEPFAKAHEDQNTFTPLIAYERAAEAMKIVGAALGIIQPKEATDARA